MTRSAYIWSISMVFNLLLMLSISSVSQSISSSIVLNKESKRETVCCQPEGMSKYKITLYVSKVGRKGTSNLERFASTLLFCSVGSLSELNE